MSDATEQACEHNAEWLMSKANVVGVAGGEDKVIVLVTTKKPLDELDPADVVDPAVEVHPRTDGSQDAERVQTDVIEVGELKPMLAEGDSIGLSGAGTGTLGAVVTDELGRMYALTNNHVAANSNRAPMLVSVLHPGPADGAGPQMGVLARYEPIHFDRPNFVDAALVRLNPGRIVTPRGRAKTTTARVGWTVNKQGRTTGLNEGKVLGRNATVDVNFGAQGVARFVGQLLTTPMLWPGDSGSLLRSRAGYAVGLGFAGSDTISIHTPINLVLRTLAVDLAD